MKLWNHTTVEEKIGGKGKFLSLVIYLYAKYKFEYRIERKLL